MAEVTIDRINKSYSGKPVLRDLSLHIPDGALFFLLGASGCGKSTLLRILAGLVEPDSGTISFDGERIDALPPEKRRAAMVFQNYALWPHLSVFDNVAFGLRCAKTPEAEIKKQVAAGLEKVELSDCADRKPAQLSGGQQQRVALARALAVRPRLLLLDEPLSNLDARLRENMRQLIRNLCKQEKLTALYVTHDRQEAFSMGDQLGIMKDGEIRQLGAPRELYEFPADRFCASFLGEANFFTGERAGDLIHLPFGDFPVRGKGGLAMIRPEHIRIGADGFPAILDNFTYLGESTIWYFRTVAGDLPLSVRGTGSTALEIGKTYQLSFDADALIGLPEA